MTPRQNGRRLSSSAGGHAVVADVRVGEGDDLAGVGRVGDDLLVARQHGVEHDLAGGDAAGGSAPMASPSNTVPSASTSRASRHRAVGACARHRCASPSTTTGSPRQERVADPAGERAAGVGGVAAAAGQRGRVDHPRGRRGRSRRGWPGRPASTGPPWLSAMPAMAAGCHDSRASTALDREVELGEGQGQRRLEAEHARAAPGRTAAPWPPGRAARGRWRWRRCVPSASPALTAATSASVRSGGFTLNTGS